MGGLHDIHGEVGVFFFFLMSLFDPELVGGWVGRRGHSVMRQAGFF